MSSRLSDLIRRHGAGSVAVRAELETEPVREPVKRRRGAVVVTMPARRRRTAMSGDGWSATAANWTRTRS